MILRRLFTLTALTLAALLSLSDRASAGFDVSTSIDTTSLIYNGGSVAFTTIIASGATPIAGGPVFTAGGASYTAPDGVTVFFQNTVSPVVTVSTGANEQIFVTAPGGLTATDTFAFKANAFIDPLGGSSYTALPQFVETIAAANPYIITVQSGGGTFGPSPAPGGLPTGAPLSVSVGGFTFFLGSPSTASGGSINSPTQNGNISVPITSIPEPASIVMLGAGLVGVVGLSLRRRKGQV